ncbi:hypothetical protein Tco_0083575 [Tanacetum coccineum]
MEAHLAPKSSIQVNKIASSCEICSGPHDTKYCMENLEQAFVDYASSHGNKSWNQLKQQQDEVFNRITLWKVVSKKISDTPIHDIAKGPAALISSVSHDHHKDGAPSNQGIKSPPKLLSPKYQSQSSLGEQNRNSSSPKRVHFINTIIIIRKEDEPKEEETVEPNETKNNNHNTIVEIKEKVGEELIRSETVIGEGDSQDIKLDNPDDRTCGDTKEVE